MQTIVPYIFSYTTKIQHSTNKRCVPNWATLHGKTVVSPRTTSISCELVSSSGSSTCLGPPVCITLLLFWRLPLPCRPPPMGMAAEWLLDCNPLNFSVLSMKLMLWLLLLWAAEGPPNWRKGKRWPRLSMWCDSFCRTGFSSWHRPVNKKVKHDLIRVDLLVVKVCPYYNCSLVRPSCLCKNCYMSVTFRAGAPST